MTVAVLTTLLLVVSWRCLYLDGHMIGLKHDLGLRSGDSFDFARDKIRSLIGEEEDG